MTVLANNTDALLALFETSKAERTERVNDLLELAAEGRIDPLKLQLQLKCMEDMINQFNNQDPKKNKNVEAAKAFRKLLIEAAARHGKAFDLHNAKFEIKEAGTKYNYAVCEDVVYTELAAQMQTLKATMSAREKFLQNIPESGIADPDNGNMIYRATKTSTTTVQVTLK